VWVAEFDRPAIVLGSTQPADTIANVEPGMELVRRRSGGGAVLLVPGEALWVDVVLPRSDPLWHDDIGVSFHWLGHVWTQALHRAGMRGARVHEGPLVHSPWSRLVCFAGLGPGEVTIENRKVVGLSQRRTKEKARFQCVAYRRFDAHRLVDLLHEPRPNADELEAMVMATGVPVDDLASAFVGALADP
jgi:lipoate---protein ligase